MGDRVVMGGVYSEPAGLRGLRPALQGGARSGDYGDVGEPVTGGRKNLLG